MLLGPVVLFAAAGQIGFALHDAGCAPTRADPATTLVVDLPDGRRLYRESRASALECFPVPEPARRELCGGAWYYEETNGVGAPEGSLQRGGIGLTGGCVPSDPLPCLVLDEDPVVDEDCGHGPDRLLV